MSHRYKLLETLGDGTYGTVVKARHRTSNDTVAIKKLRKRYKSWSDAVNLREVASLRKLSNHPHIVQVRELIRESDGSIYFVLEYMHDGNLYELIKKCTKQAAAQAAGAVSNGGGDGGDRHRMQPPRPPLPHSLTNNRIRSIVRQVLDGLSYMHSQGYFHRDIKPENILISGDRCKVADFGLAREIQSRPPYTDYVSTRWYRAPEVLLRAPRYDKSVDSFAVGCILSEMYNLCPLFPGANEIDQILKICSVLGVPTEESWGDGLRLARQLRIGFPSIVPYHHRHQYDLQKHNVIIQLPLEKAMSGAPTVAQNLTAALLTLDPAKRLSAGEALRHEYFAMPGNKRGRFDGRAAMAREQQQQQRRRQQQANANTKKSRVLEEKQDPQNDRRVGGDYNIEQPNQRQPAAASAQPQDVFGGLNFVKSRMNERARGNEQDRGSDFMSQEMKDFAPPNYDSVPKEQQLCTAKSGFHHWIRAGKAGGNTHRRM